jgi:hypothetical protein
VEKKTFRIPFGTLPMKRKQLGIPFRGTKTEAIAQNSIPNHSAEKKTTRDSVPWYKNRSKLSEFCSEPFHGRENNLEFHSVEKNRSKLSEFHSEPIREVKTTWNLVCGTKIGSNSRNAVLNHSAEEKKTKRGSQKFQK